MRPTKHLTRLYAIAFSRLLRVVLQQSAVITSPAPSKVNISCKNVRWCDRGEEVWNVTFPTSTLFTRLPVYSDFTQPQCREWWPHGKPRTAELCLETSAKLLISMAFQAFLCQIRCICGTVQLSKLKTSSACTTTKDDGKMHIFEQVGHTGKKDKSSLSQNMHIRRVELQQYWPSPEPAGFLFYLHTSI